MSRSSVLLAALTAEPTSTSDLYERVGYLALTQVGLVPYPAFRAELARLSSAGLVDSETGNDGETLWRLAGPSPGEDQRCGGSG
ncbi:MAG TPA: hypothetical protein VGH45_05375 [Solirubrobacteraceae bacterium]|jgi:hypothetical protein